MLCQTAGHMEPDRTNLLQRAFGGFENELKSAHINISSLLGSKELVEYFLEFSNFDMLLVTETWLKPFVSHSAIENEGFKPIRMDRKVGSKKSGGGRCYHLLQRLFKYHKT